MPHHAVVLQIPIIWATVAHMHTPFLANAHLGCATRQLSFSTALRASRTASFVYLYRVASWTCALTCLCVSASAAPYGNSAEAVHRQTVNERAGTGSGEVSFSANGSPITLAREHGIDVQCTDRDDLISIDAKRCKFSKFRVPPYINRLESLLRRWERDNPSCGYRQVGRLFPL